MISIQVIPDRFDAQENKLLGSGLKGGKDDKNHVRRPTRGIVLKEETFATMRLVAGNGKSITLVDAGSRRGPGQDKDGKETPFHQIGNKRATDVYSNFLLQSIQEERQEKQQILETFGEPYIFLFGERARVMTFQGVLLNTFDFNWEAEWWHNYENYLRGTKCVENDARLFLSFDETLVSGYLLGASAMKSSQEPNHVQFQFQLFITSYANFSKIGDPNAADHGTLTVSGGKYDFALDEAMAANFRPKLVDTTQDPQMRALGEQIIKGGNLGAGSLVEGVLRTGLGPIVRTFNTAQKIANTALQKLSNLAAGEVVRIPIGFEGSLAFDVDSVVSLKEITGAGKITYTTFDQNEDEYVGRGNHYGSSFDRRAQILDPFDRTLEEERNSITHTLDRARQIWSDAGLDVPAFQLGPISAFIAGKGIGLLAAGASAAWRNKNPLTSPAIRIRG